jgi:hypothetical protein
VTDVPDPPPAPAESRAIELLRLAARQTPSTSDGFTSDLVARARRQRAIAVPLRAVGGLVAAIAAAVTGAIRSGRRP